VIITEVAVDMARVTSNYTFTETVRVSGITSPQKALMVCTRPLVWCVLFIVWRDGSAVSTSHYLSSFILLTSFLYSKYHVFSRERDFLDRVSVNQICVSWRKKPL